MHDEVTGVVGEDSGDVQDPVSHRFRLGLGQGTSKQVIWLQANSDPAMSDTAIQASLAQKPSKGRLASPHAFQQRTRSSTRAWPRWRNSKAAMSSPLVLVMKQVWRHPAWVSKSESWAPGCGRSRREITRMSAGHPSSSMISVSSITSAPSRIPPSSSLARPQSSSWAKSRASRTEPLMEKPIEYSKLASVRDRTKRCEAPAESARTKMGWMTSAGSSPSSWPRAYSAGTERTTCSSNSR